MADLAREEERLVGECRERRDSEGGGGQDEGGREGGRDVGIWL